MEDYRKYLESKEGNVNLEKLESTVNWVISQYPEFNIEVKWNQPMFVYKGTFIMGMSLAKNHITVAVEGIVFNEFLNDIKALYACNKGTFKVQKNETFDLDLVKKLIDDTLIRKEGYDKFWL